MLDDSDSWGNDTHTYHQLDVVSFLLNEFRSFVLLSPTIPIFVIFLYVLSVVKDRRSLLRLSSKVSTLYTYQRHIMVQKPIKIIVAVFAKAKGESFE
jgi:hypothetical protein